MKGFKKCYCFICSFDHSEQDLYSKYFERDTILSHFTLIFQDEIRLLAEDFYDAEC